MSGSKTPFLDAHLDLLLHRLSWSDGTPDETRTLVEGNVRGAISRLVEDGVLIPADEIDARVREIASIAEGIKAACTAKPEDTQPEQRGEGDQCEACGRTYQIIYMVSDKVWEAISPGPVGPHPEHMAGGLLCPDCAHGEAEKHGWKLRFFGSESGWPDDQPIPSSELVEAVKEFLHQVHRTDARILFNTSRVHEALSSTKTEEEVRADERERLAKLVEHEIRIPLGSGQNRHTLNFQEYHITGAQLADWLRSLQIKEGE